MTDTRLPHSEPDDREPTDLIPDPVIGIDAYRRINLWNRAAAKTYGFTRAEAIGQRPPELLLTRFPVPLLEILEAVEGAGHWRGDIVQRTKDGQELTVETRWSVRYDEHGDVCGGLQIDRDVTDLPERHSAPHGEDAVNVHGAPHRPIQGNNPGEATREFAHEFNNLLTIILNYSAVIALELEAMELSSARPPWAMMREDLGEVQLASERAARLIRQLVADPRSDSSSSRGGQ